MRVRQIGLSMAHYAKELSWIRSWTELRSWLHYKLPWFSGVCEFPDKLQIETTNSCNLGCIQCHRTLPGRGEGFMEMRIFERAVAEAEHHARCSIKLVGLGEPALHPQFADMMERARRSPTRFTVYTNGTLLTRFSPEQILEWELDHIVVSIDGIDAESYADIRRGGNYEILGKAVEEFFRAREAWGDGPKIEIRHVILSGESEQELFDFRRSWAALSDTVKFNFLIEPNRHGHDDLPGPFKECRDIRREAYVRWDGRMPLCGYQFLYTDQEWLGDLHESTIADLWMHPRLQEVRQMHAQRDLRQISFCKACDSC